VPVPSWLPVPPVTVFYLHGFASSAKSTKAAYFADRLREHGMTLRCPDFNDPEFATLTLSRMIDQLGSELAGLDGRADANASTIR